MGKGGKGKSKTGAAAPVDDDALLEQAIAQANQERATGWGEDGPRQRGGHKQMAQEEIVAKLNAVPCFCLLNGENVLVGLKDLTDKTGERNIYAWFTDPKQATEMLAQCKAGSPALADSLRLGITPLGVAYAFACGWAEIPDGFDGDKQVHGSMERGSGGTAEDPMALIETMRRQAAGHGLEARTWHVPVFACAELAHPARMPLFVSRKALAESWLVAGRRLADLDAADVTALDLGVVVQQMQAGKWDGKVVQFVCERRAVALVQETEQPQPSGGVPREEVPPGQEPTRESAVEAIKQALLAEVASLHGDAGGDGGGDDSEIACVD